MLRSPGRVAAACTVACSIGASALLAACNAGGGATSGQERPAPVAVSWSDVATVRWAMLERGPVVSGRLTAELQATERAEVGGSIAEVLADVGQQVQKGDILARIHDAALRDQLLSARLTAASARTALAAARRDAERLQALEEAGAVSAQQVENAKQAVAAAQAQLGDAEARLALAREQFAHTTIRAPIAGTVSERPVNAGDVVQPGQALFTVVDPSSMRLEGSVPTAQLQQVSIGDPVRFEVIGYPDRRFEGRVTRISPVADPATGQIQVFVSIPNAGRDLVGGVFARGRIGTETESGPVVPAAAVREERGAASVTVVRDGRVQHVPVVIGLRDPLTERVLVRAGVSSGEVVLLDAGQALTEGTEVVLPRDGRDEPVLR